MRISEIINFFQKEKDRLGDVRVVTDKRDGREGWTSGFNPGPLRKMTNGVYKLDEGY